MCNYNIRQLSDFSDLILKYGEKNVENAQIFILNSYDPHGLKICIPPTVEGVTKILGAIHDEYLPAWEARHDPH